MVAGHFCPAIFLCGQPHGSIALREKSRPSQGFQRLKVQIQPESSTFCGVERA
jgi:hypothetical protein